MAGAGQGEGGEQSWTMRFLYDGHLFRQKAVEVLMILTPVLKTITKKSG